MNPMSMCLTSKYNDEAGDKNGKDARMKSFFNQKL